MNFWTPQTGVNRDGWIYQYFKDSIRGFRQTHQCSSWTNDYAAFSLMPVSGKLVVDQYQRALRFDHKNEIAKPHYYKVTFDNNLITEMSPTERGVYFRFSFPQEKDAYVVLDGNSGGSMYTCNPDGYCGDEDNGQTSAWYVFSSLGFYPVCPGTDEYVLGAPLFKKATVHFENGNKLIINAPENSDKNRYIEAMTLNGKTYTKNYLKHASVKR